MLSTGNCIQYPVISHNGKEYEKESIYMYICVYIYVYITESLCCAAEISKTFVNQQYVNKFFLK